MKIALISSCKNLEFKKFIYPSCTEIITNIPNLENSIQNIPITCTNDFDELIKNADWVIVIYDKDHRKLPPVFSKCRKYHVTTEIVNADAF